MAYGVNVLLRICASRYHVLSTFGLFTGKNKRSGDSQVATRVKLFHSIFAQRQAFCLSLELYGRLSLTLDNHEPLMHCSTPIKHGITGLSIAVLDQSHYLSDWLNTVWVYSEQETENGPRSCCIYLGQFIWKGSHSTVVKWPCALYCSRFVN